jgi:hemolysin activation/secretion protein
VLALRAYAAFADADRRARVPFYLQETLGGSHTLRGFPSFRYRGENLALLQAEYRWEASPAIELALFADAGTVAATARGLDLGRLEAGYGFGLRFKTTSSPILRLDLARGREGARLLVRFTGSF